MITTDQLVEALQKYPAGTPVVIPGLLQHRTVQGESGPVTLDLITFEHLKTADLPWTRVVPESELLPDSSSDLLVMIEKEAEGHGQPVVILPVRSIQAGASSGCAICTENPPTSDT